MSSEEIRRLERRIDERADEIMSTIAKHGDRISTLELDKARREGRESVMTKSKPVDWPKLLTTLGTALVIALGIAYALVKELFK